MVASIGHYIDNKPVAGKSGRTGDITNPATGEVTAKVAALRPLRRVARLSAGAPRPPCFAMRFAIGESFLPEGRGCAPGEVQLAWRRGLTRAVRGGRAEPDAQPRQQSQDPRDSFKHDALFRIRTRHRIRRFT